MATIKNTFLRKLFIIVNVVVIVCYLLSCLVPFINTEIFWFVALLGLVFPLIFFALLAFVIFWLIFRSRWWYISLLVLLIGFKQIVSVFAFNLPTDFTLAKNENTIRVVQYNVSNFDHKSDNDLSYRDKMMDLIRQQNADILCIEEFYQSKRNKSHNRNIEAFKEMGYPFSYFIPSNGERDSYQSGIAILSKYPISNPRNFPFSDGPGGEHLLQADMAINGKTFRVFATHLQSVRFEESDYESLSKIKKVQKVSPHASKVVVSKLKRGYEFRYRQAELVKRQIESSPYPVIICGDFNDVPNSSTYFKIKGKMQDAFLEKGSFMGRTFRFISPTLRIDYILAQKTFTVKQFKRLKVPYSDHYGLVADLEYEP